MCIVSTKHGKQKQQQHLENFWRGVVLAVTMKVFVVLSVLAVAVSARPEPPVGGGYSYSAPSFSSAADGGSYYSGGNQVQGAYKCGLITL